MKIFLSFLQSKIQHPIAAYSFWEYYIKNGIEESGHTWIEDVEVDWAEGIVPQSDEKRAQWRAHTWQKTLDTLKKQRPDLFLSYLYPEQVDEQAILEIQKLGIYCVNFFCDNVRLFKKVPKVYNVFDINWVPEVKALKIYQEAKAKYINLPMPMWISPQYRTPSSNELDRISFIGSKDIQRTLLFNSLVEKQDLPNLDIYGSGWQDTGELTNNPPQSSSLLKTVKNQISFIAKHGVSSYLNKVRSMSQKIETSTILEAHIKEKPNFDDYIKLTREAKITLGVNRYPSFNYPLNQPDTYSRLRDLEAPMLGACYLTEHTAGLDEMYEIGTEIETYRDVDELLHKISLLEKNAQLRKKLRLKGQQRALNFNSIVQSIEKIRIRMTGRND